MIKDFCRTSGGLRALLLVSYVLKILFILVPIIIIIMSIIHLSKVVTGKSEEETRNFIASFLKRITAAILVFVMPSFVTYMVGLGGEDTYEYKVCMERATLDEVKYYEKTYEPALSEVEKAAANPSKSVLNETREMIASNSDLRGEDKEDLLAKLDAAAAKSDEYAAIIECKNSGGDWVNNECVTITKPEGKYSGNSSGNNGGSSGGTTGSGNVDNTTGENGEYFYQGNGNDGGTIDYNGYDVIQSAVSVNDYLKVVSSNRIAQNNDTSVYSGYCLAFSYIHAYSLYSGNTSARASDALNYKYAGKFQTYIDSEDKILAVTYNEVTKGRPVIIQVNGNKTGTSRHFVTVVGIKKGVTASTIKETDLLIIDSWDGKLETMNGKGSGTRFLTSGADCHKDYSGYRIQYLK